MRKDRTEMVTAQFPEIGNVDITKEQAYKIKRLQELIRNRKPQKQNDHGKNR